MAAYPRVSKNVPQRSGFRDSDAINGGTWEAFERVLQKHGYFKGGLRKIEVARELGARLDPARSRSPSFLTFCSVIREMCAHAAGAAPQ